MASVAVCSEVVNLLLMIHCLLLLPLCWVFVLYLTSYCIVYFVLSFLVCCHLAEVKRVGCFTLIMLSCGCQCSFIFSPLVSWVSLWPMLVAFLGHTHLFWALLSSSA